MADWRDLYAAAQARAKAKIAAVGQPPVPPEQGMSPEYIDQLVNLGRMNADPTLGEQAQDFASGALSGLSSVVGALPYAAGMATGSDKLKAVGEGISGAGAKVIPPSNPYRQTLGGEVGGFLGGTAPFLLAGQPELGLLSRIPAWARMAGLGATSGFGSGAMEAAKAGATPGEQWAYGAAQGAIGAGMALPAESILGATGKPFLESLPGVAGTNAAYGAAAQLGTNIAKQQTFAPETETEAGVGRQALVAGLGGTLAHAGIHAVQPVPGEALRSGIEPVGEGLLGTRPEKPQVRYRDFSTLASEQQEAVRRFQADMPKVELAVSEPSTPAEQGAEDLVSGAGASVLMVEDKTGKPLPNQGMYHFDEATGKSVILVDRNVQAPPGERDVPLRKAVFWHEVTHLIEQRDPALFQKLIGSLDQGLLKSEVGARLGLAPEAVTPEHIQREGPSYLAEKLAEFLDLHLTQPDRLHELLTSKPAPILQAFDAVTQVLQSFGLRKGARLFSETHLARALGEVAKVSAVSGTKVDPKAAALQSRPIADALRQFLGSSAGTPKAVDWGVKPEQPAAPQPIPKPAQPDISIGPAEQPVQVVGPDGKPYTVKSAKALRHVLLLNEAGQTVRVSRKAFEKNYREVGKEPTPEETAQAMRQPLPEEQPEMAAPEPQEIPPEQPASVVPSQPEATQARAEQSSELPTAVLAQIEELRAKGLPDRRIAFELDLADAQLPPRKAEAQKPVVELKAESQAPVAEKSHRKQPQAADPLVGSQIVERQTGKKFVVARTTEKFAFYDDGGVEKRVRREDLPARFAGEQIPERQALEPATPKTDPLLRQQVSDAITQHFSEIEGEGSDAREQQNTARVALAERLLAMLAQRPGEMFTLDDMANAIAQVEQVGDTQRLTPAESDRQEIERATQTSVTETEAGFTQGNQEGKVTEAGAEHAGAEGVRRPLSPREIGELAGGIRTLMDALFQAKLIAAGQTRDAEGHPVFHFGAKGARKLPGMEQFRGGRTVKERAERKASPELSQEDERLQAQLFRLGLNLEQLGLGRLSDDSKTFSPKTREARDIYDSARKYLEEGKGDLLDFLREQPVIKDALAGKPGSELFSKAPRAPAYNGAEYQIPEETRKELWKRVIADSYAYPRRVLRDVLGQSKETIEQLADKSNFDQALTLYPGKVRSRFDESDRGLVEPLMRLLRANKLSTDEGGAALEAFAAEQRNRVGAEVNRRRLQREENKLAKAEHRKPKTVTPEFDPAGEVYPYSGMKTSEARAKIAEMQASPQAAVYAELRELNRKLQGGRLDMLVEYGLWSQKKADKVAAVWGPDYVPFRNEGDIRPRAAGSLPSKGRHTRASDFLAHSVQQLGDTILYGERNQVYNSIKNFLLGHPDQRLWGVHTKTGTIPTKQKKNVILLREDGRKKYLSFASKEFAKAIKQQNLYRTDTITRTLGRWSQVYARLNTTWSPDFLLTNFVRDIGEATLNLSTEGKRNLVKNLHKDAPGAVRAMWDLQKNPDAPGEWHDIARRFRAAGGETGWAFVEDLPELAKKLERRVQDGNTKPYDPRIAWQGIKAVGRFMERANGALENGTRLSVFKACVEHGMSDAKAAALAKGITVDFNRRGEMTPFFNALFTFFNANVQSTMRIFTGFHKSPAKLAMAGSLAGFGFATGLLNRYVLSDRDDDGELYYDKKSDWEKSRELILMIPGGKGRSINIPLPWGWSLFNALGVQGDKIAHVGTSKARFAAAMWQAGMDSFNPMGSSPTLAQFLSPTLFDPVVQIAENKDFAGRPVAPSEDPFAHPKKPDSERFFSTVSPAALGTARFLNRLSGGDLLTSGAVDLSPEWLELLASQLVGGAGASAYRLAKSTENAIQGNFSLNDTPILRRFTRGTDEERQIQSTYYEHVNEVALAVQRVKQDVGADEARQSADYAQRFQMNVADRRIQVLKKQLKAAGDDQVKRARLQAQIEDTMRQFNRGFSKAQ